MVVAGIEEAARMFELCGADSRVVVGTGDYVNAGSVLLEASGSAGALHAAWKVAQTFVEIWSGVATAARLLTVKATSVDPSVKIACTRKNVPGTKAIAVKAVRAGGAIPHRLGLSETVLVFAEHRIFLKEELIVTFQRLRDEAPEKKLIIEVSTQEDALMAASIGFDVIQTERFSPESVQFLSKKTSAMRPRPLIAAAAGINPDNVVAYVQAGADIIVTSWPYTARPADVKVSFKAL